MPSPPFTPQSASAWAPLPPLPPSAFGSLDSLKGPSSGRNVGGDAPNEDEYSAALERLLEGCPASTHGSSQIGDTVNGGGGGGAFPFTFGE